MKNFIMKSLKNKVAATALFLVTLLSLSFASSANGGHKGTDQTGYMVKYVGESENGLVFTLKYENPDAAKVQLVLKNADGTILFRNTFSEKELDKKIVLTKDNDTNQVSFILKTNKGDLVQNFTIKTKTVEVVDVQSAD